MSQAQKILDSSSIYKFVDSYISSLTFVHYRFLKLC